MKTQTSRQFFALMLVVILALGWNYWLPTAENFYNLVTKANANRARDLQNVDFYAYYNAGARFSNGENPYYWGEQFSDYLYPPTLLPMYSLLARLPYNQARLFWLAMYFIVYLIAMTSLALTLQRELRLVFWILAVLLTLVSFPLLNHIHNGQADVFIAGFSMGGLAAYARGRRWLAAFLFALGTVMKVSPLLFLIFFVIYLRDWSFLVEFLVNCLGLCLLSLIFIPAGLYPDYILNILPEISKGTDYWINQSLLKYLYGNAIVAQLVAVMGIIGFMVLTWVIRQRSRLQESRLVAPLDRGAMTVVTIFLMNLLVILVFAGKAWSMAYAWTILPAALYLTLLLQVEPRPIYLYLNIAGIFLISAKVYGYPLLDSLNLWGSLLLLGLCGTGLLFRRQAFRHVPWLDVK